jgi:Putative prokaryotic signal transducing protein
MDEAVRHAAGLGMRRRGKVIPFPGRGIQPSRVTRAGHEPGTSAEPGLVVVYRCDQAEAVVVKSLLESEGIPTFFRSRLIHSVHPFSVGSQGEVTILVPEAEAVRSRRLLARLVRGSGSSAP